MGESPRQFGMEVLLKRDGLTVSRSPWGVSDEIGRLNWINSESRVQALTGLAADNAYDLAVDYFIGMPIWVDAGDPKFEMWMTHTPAGTAIDRRTGLSQDVHAKYSYSGDAISMYTHTGTHMDTLNHMGYYGCIWNGWTAEQHLGSRHWTVCGSDKYPPIIARGVLLDVARLLGVARLEDGHVITPDELRGAVDAEGIQLRRGDVVLIRTGAMTEWPNSAASTLAEPGIGMAAAHYLCEEAGAMCIGADNAGLEVITDADRDVWQPVHAYMFATAGAQILELVWTEDLARAQVYEFAFIATPLKIRGATGAPVRPIAIPYSR